MTIACDTASRSMRRLVPLSRMTPRMSQLVAAGEKRTRQYLCKHAKVRSDK